MTKGNYFDDLPKFSVLIRKHHPEEKWIDAKDAIMHYYDEIYPNRETPPTDVTDSTE